MNEAQKVNGTGIKIRTVNVIVLILTAIVFGCILYISTLVKTKFNVLESTLKKFVICQRCSEQITNASNLLTEQARLFVITQRDEYAISYIKEITDTKTYEKALETMSSVYSAQDTTLQQLKVAIRQVKTLTDMDMYAMRLIYRALNDKNLPGIINEIEVNSMDKALSPEGLKQRAISLLFSSGYIVQKQKVTENCTLVIDSMEKQMQKEIDMQSVDLGVNITKLRLLYLLLIIVCISIFIFLICYISKPLEKFITKLDENEKLDVIGSFEIRRLATRYNEIYDMKLKTEQALIIQAEYDTLTGILNRRAFEKVCQNSSKTRQPVALLMIDMDNFKYINDTYGHSGGDTALQELARILKETFRTNDYIARIGGDEFAALLPNFQKTSSMTIKQKIVSVNAKLIAVKGGIKPLSVSVGCSFSETGFSKQLMREADDALYAVKENGKKGCMIYDEIQKENPPKLQPSETNI